MPPTPASHAPPRTKEEVVRDFRTREILQAARQVISELGYAGASMERIAHDAGIAKGTIYLYFRNKEHLLSASFAEAFAELMARTRAASAVAPDRSAEVRAIVSVFFTHTAENGAFFRALQGHPDVGPEGETEAAEQVRKQIEEYQQFVADRIEAGIRAGEFRDVDPARCAMFLTDLLKGVVWAQIRGPADIDPEADVDAFVDFFFYGIARGGAH